MDKVRIVIHLSTQPRKAMDFFANDDVESHNKNNALSSSGLVSLGTIWLGLENSPCSTTNSDCSSPSLAHCLPANIKSIEYRQQHQRR